MIYSMHNYYVSGEWNLCCDVCSKKIKASESRKRWDGFIVCSDDYETRHPQDFVRARQDKISIPFSRPIPTIIFTNVSYNLYCDYGYYKMGYVKEDI